MASILIIEDDDTLSMSLRFCLEAAGHAVRCSGTLETGREEAHRLPPDLLVLDLGLPDGDGIELCRELRAQGNISPILILTARGNAHARVAGLEAGADDYVAKPFELEELLARIEALLRRQRWHGRGERLQIGRLLVDFRRYEATCDGEKVPLTELEFRLLHFLVSKDGEAASRQELLARVWNLSPRVRTRTVDVFMSRLRRALEEDSAHPRHILNVRGLGYRLVISPEDSERRGSSG